MTDKSTKKANAPFRFISYDGRDEDNTRAEVLVQVNKGTVKEIKENTEKNVADVHFAVDKLKLPIHGWVRTDTPLYELVKTAYESKEEVNFRIETQRKYNVDRSIPMEELRSDANKARENVRVILVGINGFLSDEAVTNPAEDPKATSGGRYVATPEDMKSANNENTTTVAFDLTTALENYAALAANSDVRPTVLDAMAAQLLLQGATIDQINAAIAGPSKQDNTKPELRASFSVEAPSWKEYNSDGRLNLGSAIIAAGVGMETLVNDRLATIVEEAGLDNVTNIDDAVSYYTSTLFAICDRIQEYTYGKGFRVERGAQSHVRIRGIVYEMVKKNFPLPVKVDTATKTLRVNQTDHDTWVKAIGQEGMKRFARAIGISTHPADLKAPIPASLTGGVATPAATAPAATQTATQVVEEAPENPYPAVEQPTVEAPANIVESTVNEEPVPTYSKDEALQKAADIIKQGETAEVAPTIDFYQEPLTPDMVEGEELATPETIERFKNVLANLGLNVSDTAELARISKLLKFTFGENYSNARKIPDVTLENFIDFYESAGAEALDAAIREALK